MWRRLHRSDLWPAWVLGSYLVCKIYNTSFINSSLKGVVVFIDPVITVPPKDVSSELYSSVCLPCVAESSPTPVITWLKDDRQINATACGARSGGLMITELKPSDRGFYSCSVTNGRRKVDSDKALVNINGEVHRHQLWRWLRGISCRYCAVWSCDQVHINHV